MDTFLFLPGSSSEFSAFLSFAPNSLRYCYKLAAAGVVIFYTPAALILLLSYTAALLLFHYVGIIVSWFSGVLNCSVLRCVA